MDAVAPPPRRRRIGWLPILIALALVAGIAMMTYAIRTSGGLFATPANAPAATDARRAPVSAPSPVAQARAAPLPMADAATLATREAALAGQLASLETRTAAVAADVQGAAGQAARAEAILVAAAVRRALDHGAPLGYLEEQLRRRFGTIEPQASVLVIRAARQPVTLEGLRQGLDAIEPALTGSGDGWLATIGHDLANLVVIHQASTPSPLPQERFARARRLIDAGQVGAALAEVLRLPGAEASRSWTDAARRYVLTRRALDAIEAAAILGQPTALPVPTPPPVPASETQPLTR